MGPWDFAINRQLFDIDFVAQYLALRHADANPEILDPHPAEMLRRTAAAGLISPDDAVDLVRTRSLLSDVQSVLRLTLDGDEAGFDEAKAPEGQRQRSQTAHSRQYCASRCQIADEVAGARAIYRRLVEEPARAAGWKPRRA